MYVAYTDCLASGPARRHHDYAHPGQENAAREGQPPPPAMVNTGNEEPCARPRPHRLVTRRRLSCSFLTRMSHRLLSIIGIENPYFYLCSVFGRMYSMNLCPTCPPLLLEPGPANRVGRHCSSSIVHLHQANRLLREGRADRDQVWRQGRGPGVRPKTIVKILYDQRPRDTTTEPLDCDGRHHATDRYARHAESCLP